MKVFISYGSAGDQVTALRLQALAAVNGLTVYVPPAYTRQGSAVLIEPESGRKLNEADVVLGVVRAGFSEACRGELNTGLNLGKTTIVMADPAFALQLQPYYGPNLVVIDPAYPDQAELGIVRQLRSVEGGQNEKMAVLGLGTLALGLLIFAPQD